MIDTGSNKNTVIDAEVIERDPGTSELVTMSDEADAPAISLYGSMSVSQLKKATQKMAEQRQVITQYVSDQLVEGTDYGKIHVNRDCADKYNCDKSYHFSKPVLFKPGQEKIFSLFNLTARLYQDEDTLKMLGGTSGLVALICKVYRNGKEIAEGRGAAMIGDNKRDANATIKIAEKRARMDACLSLGFSEFFTQDLEDPEYRGDSAASGRKKLQATEKQRALIQRKLHENGIASEDQAGYLIEQFGVDIPLTKEGASFVIDNLIAG